MDKDKSFLGMGWSFPPTFVKNHSLLMVCDNEDIQQSLQILFSTELGERIFHVDYGCNLRSWIFENFDLSLKTLVIQRIKDAVLFFEPRIIIDKLDVEIKDYFEGILWINLDYRIIQTNSRSNMVYPFYLREGSNI